MSELSKTTAPLKALKQQQPEKFWRKVQRTVLGIGTAALGIVGLAVWKWAWYVGVPLTLLGATIWSGEMVTLPLKSLIALGRDLVKALKGQNGAA